MLECKTAREIVGFLALFAYVAIHPGVAADPSQQRRTRPGIMPIGR
ncbi:hypothetical protein MPS_4554 [Mycobacterium pseudoshottsii JCM 15466]|nr:hypothetical protein MMSP_0757 [Mycobacterium sp. 012931]EPQ79127.1 hypothetical protein MMMB2_3790 [Mycobacterium marinum MB2]GAQ39158.1 hypothetical protein MPS_4554 [Mycobacterium pseudoshottsii JCM 15466]